VGPRNQPLGVGMDPLERGSFFWGGDISMPTASIEDIRHAVDISTSYVIWQG